MFDPVSLGEFIGLAQQLRSDGATYVPAREREALLPVGVADNLTLIGRGIAKPSGCPRWIDHIGLSPEIARLIGVD